MVDFNRAKKENSSPKSPGLVGPILMKVVVLVNQARFSVLASQACSGVDEALSSFIWKSTCELQVTVIPALFGFLK